MSITLRKSRGKFALEAPNGDTPSVELEDLNKVYERIELEKTCVDRTESALMNIAETVAGAGSVSDGLQQALAVERNLEEDLKKIRKSPFTIFRPPVQLETTVPKGGTKTPNIVHPDGHDTAFSIPAGKTFVVTDVSIQRLSAVGTAILLEVSLTQDIPLGGATINRWCFVGETTANVERTFSTGVAFSTPFVVTNGSQSGDAVVVRLWGFFR